jgi:outer membrane protein assembly factor BamB
MMATNSPAGDAKAMRLGRSLFIWQSACVLAGLAFAERAHAQAVPPQADAPATGRAPAAELEAPHGATPRELVKRLQAGRKLLVEGNYAEGARLLQLILENDEDAFFFPDQEDRSKERSVKLEAQTLLGQMPAAGREVYEKQYGPAARRLFEEAQKSRDGDDLAVVARKYFHTPWGYEAAYRLAADHFDHERALTAALCFERLRGLPHAAGRFEPWLSLKTALAWRQAGWDDRAVEVLLDLRAARGQKPIVLGGREVGFFDQPSRALTWLAALGGEHPAAAAAGHEQWMSVGGDSRRNARSGGGSPYLNRGWRSSTVAGATGSDDHDAILARMFPERRPAGLAGPDEANISPSLPTLQPLVVDNLAVVRGIGDVRAYDLATGRLVWATGEKDQLLIELLRTAVGPQAPPPGSGNLALCIANRVFEDTTFGALASDGEFVFAVEDLGVPALPRGTPVLRDFNRLVAYDVRTGRAMWEVGGPRSDTGDELAGLCFLGAPLVLDRRLYCLAESGSEVRLVVLEPQTGRLDWSQTLNSSAPAGFNFYQRQSGLSPSFMGEVLVCPIGADQVVAVDVTRRLLAWRHWFQNPADLYDPRRQQLFNLQQQQRVAQQQGGWPIDQNRWLDSQAVISEMRVIVTPRDANELYCLNLLDGSLVWSRPRGEGLFVAGIHHGKVLVVGRSYVQALSVSDGEPAWPEPASLPLPSGRGFVAGDLLHLPLATAEVATISLRDGRVVARARSLAGNVPGNLVAVRGAVVSQGPDFVEAFRQLDALETEIAAALARDPADAQALALRGEIQLQRGNVASAYADLKRVLELKSDDAAVRSLLVGSLLEGLRVDFEAYRGLDADIERLLVAPDERSAYLWLTAQGQRRAGEPRQALATLLRFADPEVADRELERLDGTLVVRRDRMVQARAAELYASVAPGERLEIDRDFRTRAERLSESKNHAGLRRFLRYFGRLGPAGEFDRLSASLPIEDSDWLDDEIRLEKLGASKDESVAARATAQMAQLLLDADRPRDALVVIRRLEQRWPDVVCHDGKTGRLLAAQWRRRADIERETALDAPWPKGEVEVDREGSVPVAVGGQRPLELPLAGQRGPFFSDAMLHVSSGWKELFARDAFGRLLWKVSFDNPLQQQVNALFNRAYTSGHFVLALVGTQVLAIDTLGSADQPGARLLWRMSLASFARGNMAPRMAAINARRRMLPWNQLGEQIGSIGPVNRTQVTILNGHKLMALDLVTGKPFWMREGIAGAELFGDDERLFVVPLEGSQALVLSTLDGTIVGNRKLPPYTQRLDTVGRNIVTWGVRDSRQVLTLHDPWLGKDLWSRSFEDTAQVTLIENEEAAVLEASGKFTVVSLGDGSVRLEGPTERELLVRQIQVIRSNDHYVLIANQAPSDPPGWPRVTPQTIAIKGRVYGYDRATGKRLWTHEFDRHGIELGQPANLPVLTLICNFQGQRRNGPGSENFYGLTCIDKRTGRIVFDDRELKEQFLWVDYAADPDDKQLELRLFRSIVRLTFTDKPVASP